MSNYLKCLINLKDVISVRDDEDGIFINTDVTNETEAEKILDMLIEIIERYGDKNCFHFGLKRMKELYPNDNLNEEIANHYAVYANLK